MKKVLFMICLVAGGFSCLVAQQKVYETKVTTGNVMGFGTNNEVSVYAGAKNYNVVKLADGKVLLDKSYKDAGSVVSKGIDGSVSDDAGKLVVCDENNVACFDAVSGSKVWESGGFNSLSGSSLMICDNVVLISDKKAKDNFTLTCLSLAEGKTLWTIADEKSKIQIDNIYFISPTLAIYTPGTKKSEKNSLKLVDAQTGKVDATIELEGSPIASLGDHTTGVLYIHNRVSEENSYLTAISMKDRKMLWKVKSANKSPQTPMTMNTDVLTYYGKVESFDDKVMLITEGIEVYDAASGKLTYNIPFVPYYKWGVGHYTNGIFYPEVTSYGILIADRTKGDMYIKMFDKNTGSELWSTPKLKDFDSAPVAVVSENSAAIQFGGLNYFEVMNNTGIGKLLKPFVVSSFDLKTGKQIWSYESKKDFYYIAESNNDVMVVGTKDFQTLDSKTGSVISTEKNPFGENYFMTKFALNSMHKIQKNTDFDFSARKAILFEDGKLTVYKF